MKHLDLQFVLHTALIIKAKKKKPHHFVSDMQILSEILHVLMTSIKINLLYFFSFKLSFCPTSTL